MVVRRRPNLGDRGLVDEGSGYRTPRARNQAVKPIEPTDLPPAEQRALQRELGPEVYGAIKKRFSQPNKLGKASPQPKGIDSPKWKRWGGGV